MTSQAKFIPKDAKHFPGKLFDVPALRRCAMQVFAVMTVKFSVPTDE